MVIDDWLVGLLDIATLRYFCSPIHQKDRARSAAEHAELNVPTAQCAGAPLGNATIILVVCSPLY